MDKLEYHSLVVVVEELVELHFVEDIDFEEDINFVEEL